ncbi:hypothetical protein [uncultured Leifsonia sp.]|uniref:hypothetical protein n=1 Tax=uncultured Leifsonia sp. TaxID=340359 RepID=UPI0028D1BFEB|nr:hypothetical protein [uncultured Leifsonia sp.]
MIRSILRAKTPDPEVLELRIHGIDNTPAEEMLGVPPGQARLDEGDDVGGFYVPTVDPLDPDDPATPPTRIRREGYRWGGLARYGGGAKGVIALFFVQLAWLLILPFGLCNTAYWMRRIPDQPDVGEWRAGRGAAPIRVFALGLTLLYVCALASVAFDLVGSQCLVDGTRCTGLPSGVHDALVTLGLDYRGFRLAVLSLVPVAGVLVLFLVSHAARVRYEAAIFDTAHKMHEAAARSGVEGTMRRPLATEGFWGITRVKLPSELLHLTATLFLVALLLSWDAVFAECGASAESVSLPAACWQGAGSPLFRYWWISLLGALAIAGLVFAVFAVALQARTHVTRRQQRQIASVGRGAGDRLRRELVREKLRRRDRSAVIALLFGIAVYLAVAVVIALPTERAERVHASFLGLVITPSLVLGVLLAIAVSALGWRRLGDPKLWRREHRRWVRGIPSALSIALVALGGVALLVAALWPPAAPAAYAVAGGCVLVLVLLIVVWPSARRRPNRYEGWRGAGPGVVLLLALGAALLLSTLLVFGAQCYLTSTGSPPMCNLAASALDPPRAFANFGDLVPVLVVVFALFVGIVGLARMMHLPWLTTPRTDGGRELRMPLERYEGGRVRTAPPAGKLDTRILRARRSAALFHRGEPVLGFLALLLAVAIGIDLVLADKRWTGLLDLTLPALGLVAVFGIVAILDNAITTKERPIGVMWDLMCFLPRGGHPYGPPCYSERVVPELRDRIVAWLETDLVRGKTVDGRDTRSPERQTEDELAALTEPQRRKVILSAHSLGGVLAVSTLFTLGSDTAGGLRNVGLLTYGTQLRVYFGRFFPELYGPAALGGHRSRGPSLVSADPWRRQVNEDQAAGAVPVAGGDHPTLRELLRQPGPGGPIAWINLWRRTDFLGFPDVSYGRNDIDRGADEFGPQRYLITVATHSNYPATAQYYTALRELMRRI